MRDQKDILLEELMPLIDSIAEFREGNFLKPTTSLYNTVLTRCIELLRANNYIVTRSEINGGSITNVGDLVNHYYNLLRFKTNNSIRPYRDQGADLATAKAFMNTIQESTGYEYAEALNFAGRLVFEFFNLYRDWDISPEAMCAFKGVFGQDRMGWITERLIKHINKEALSQAKAEHQAELDTQEYIKIKKVEFGWPDLAELVKKKKEEQDGKS